MKVSKVSLVNVYWITEDFNLKDFNTISGPNGSGKSTIINSIIEVLKWKTNIKDWKAEITFDDWQVYSIAKGKLIWSPWFGNQMDLMTPWFLMNGTPVTWINKTHEDRRKTLSEVLGIDRDQFFKDAGIDYNTKWLASELKDLKTREATYTSEIIKEEEKLMNHKAIDKPTTVELIEDNSQWLTHLKEKVEHLKSLIKSLQALPEKPTPVQLIQWNESDLNTMKSQLTSILEQWKSVTDTCPTCSQKLPDAETVKQKYRNDYKELWEKINNFILQPSNTEEYMQYQKAQSNYDNIFSNNKIIEEENAKIQTRITQLEEEIKNYKLVSGNTDAYKAYQEVLSLYNQDQAAIQWAKLRIEEMTSIIQSLNTDEIEDKIKAYKKTERKFVEFVENKLAIWDLRILFYRELKTPNTDGDIYTPTFEIEYQWKPYSELSAWFKWVVDILLARIFIQAYKLIDFVLVDNAEISAENIKMIQEEYFKDFQFIHTSIAKTKLSIKSS